MCAKMAWNAVGEFGWGEYALPTELIRELVRRSYEVYDLGNRAFVLDLFDDEIEWVFHLPPGLIPIPTRVRGKAAVIAALMKIDEVFDHIRNDLELILVDGDQAVVIVNRTVRRRASGEIMTSKVAAFHRYRDGRLVEYQAFTDGADVLHQAMRVATGAPAA
jgi:ketosteroid isomerase-like protein